MNAALIAKHCVRGFIEESGATGDEVSTVALILLCSDTDIIESACYDGSPWALNSSLAKAIMSYGKGSELCIMLRTIVGLKLTPEDFWSLFQRAISSAATQYDTYNAIAASVDYCRARSVRFDLPQESVDALLYSDESEYRIIALKALHYCDAKSEVEIVSSLEAALRSGLEDEQIGGLYELGVYLDSIVNQTSSQVSLKLFKNTMNLVNELSTSSDCDTIRDMAARRLDALRSL